MKKFNLAAVLQLVTDYIVAPKEEVSELQDYLEDKKDKEHILLNALNLKDKKHIDYRQLAMNLKQAQSDEERQSTIAEWLNCQIARFGKEVCIP